MIADDLPIFPNGTMLGDGKFEILNHLGSGYYGHVYHVHNHAVSEQQALKLIPYSDPQEFAKAHSEAKLLNKAKHKHIVDIRDACILYIDHDGQRYSTLAISMEYLQEGSLQKYLEEKFVSVKQAVNWISQALFGLSNAHKEAILHRDIKPGNIMFGSNSIVKISDFGLATLSSNTPLNSFDYLIHRSPEIVRGEDPSEISDIYAMGLTLYRLINQKSSLRSEYFLLKDPDHAILTGEFPNRNDFLAHVPQKVIKIIKKSIHHKDDIRYGSAEKFQNALSRLRPDIDWNPINPQFHWQGFDLASNLHEVTISHRPIKKIHEFRQLKNERSVPGTTKEFPTYARANYHMMETIRQTTLS